LELTRRAGPRGAVLVLVFVRSLHSDGSLRPYLMYFLTASTYVVKFCGWPAWAASSFRDLVWPRGCVFIVRIEAIRSLKTRKTAYVCIQIDRRNWKQHLGIWAFGGGVEGSVGLISTHTRLLLSFVSQMADMSSHSTSTMLRGSAHTRAGLRANQTHGGVLHHGDGNSNPDAHFCAARCSSSNKASTEQTAHLDRHPVCA
jgi:hypothetical protein